MEMNYQQAIDYLSSYTDYEIVPRLAHNAINYDLRRVEELLSRLGNPHLKARSVHIAGTNGKGSISAMIASALIASGYITGLYISPHLHTWRERIRVDEKLISEDELVALVQKLKPEVEAVNEKATYGRLTTFELLTTLAYDYFAQKRADFQVLEVGMGGKYDATNVINPDVGIIASVSFDHMDVLGNTLSEIAAEKAGIIKSGSTVVMSPQFEEAGRVIEKTCARQRANLIRVGSDITWQGLGFNLSGQRLNVKGRLGDYELFVPLLGQHQLVNTATAVAALEVLAEKGFHISRDSIVKGMAQVSWPGRFQIISQRPLILVDGGHNPDAARKLREAIQRYLQFEKAILVIGASSDKDIRGTLSELLPVFDKIIATRSHHPRAVEPSVILSMAAGHDIEKREEEDIPAALSRAISLAGERDLICITGSLFVVAEALEEAERLGLAAKN